ncbi:DMT family transporter [Chromobacterium paludis]|uniref:DMT family transporter n=2 Tax=Chromobacterium paludis TaxID=2605945 RepID=A0A5C1DHI5_9NEIS|nr:DMT family transporter [Chromobacterium paludis]
MGYLMLLALTNGFCIAASRAINGKLAQSRGAMSASFWNHLGGFLFLSLLLIVGSAPYRLPLQAPGLAWLGGAMGAWFVAINSMALPRLGVMKTTLLVITGQMISGVLIDHVSGASAKSAPLQLVGIALILAGLYLSKRRPESPAESPTPSGMRKPTL